MLVRKDIEATPGIDKLIANGYSISNVYCYDDINGNALFWRVRLDKPGDKKEYRPIHLQSGDILAVGEPSLIPKPLYGNSLLSNYPDAKVWIVEGEKCTDRLNEFFDAFGALESHIAITSGSASSADKAGWSLLVGREAFIWPDTHPSGRGYASSVANALGGMVASIDCIDECRIGLSDGEDCYEWLEKHPDATIGDLLKLPHIKPELSNDDIDMVCIDDIESKPVNWLWPDRIAKGKLSVLAGDPGLGKSQLTIKLASTVSNGSAWPDCDNHNPPGNVIFLSAEDDAADTIRPRLEAAGADLTKCHVINAVCLNDEKGNSYERIFDLAEDLDRLCKKVSNLGNVSLVVIDPISAYMGGIDSHNNAQVRSFVMPLCKMAEEHQFAVLALTHMNKDEKQQAMNRIIGSIGLVAAARAGYLVIKDKDNPDLRYFLPVKNNIGNDKDGFSYEIESAEVAGGIQTSCINWLDIGVDAHSILHPMAEEKVTVVSEGEELLQQIMVDGEILVKKAFEEGEELGLSQSALRRASKKMGLRAEKSSMSGGWVWKDPVDLSYLEGTEGVSDMEVEPS